jgi:hypothetical protein
MKRHPLDVLALVAGMLFAGLGAVFLLDALNVFSADVSWIPPIVLIVLGFAGVLSTIGRRSERASARRQDEIRDDPTVVAAGDSELVHAGNTDATDEHVVEP